MQLIRSFSSIPIKLSYVLIGIILFSCQEPDTAKPLYHPMGEMAGELTHNSVILQSRLSTADSLVDGGLPGARGYGQFEWSKNKDFSGSQKSPWFLTRPENDHIIKTKIKGLEPNTVYFYRLRFGHDSLTVDNGPLRQFRTLPGEKSDAGVSFAVVTGMNFHRFHFGRVNDPSLAYTGPDKELGFPALATMTSLAPDFVVFTGDNVYYDTPADDSLRAKTLPEMRKKWHQQFIQPRFEELFAKVATYWEKDDHDHRYNDSDTTTNEAPSHQLGIAAFKEQVPITDPEDEDAVTYRTHRVNSFLQIWLTENRDYRSPNAMPDGPEKSIWGERQKNWLKETLLESDAKFKLLITPTPMIGPDDAYKKDNHTNPEGFSHEGMEFLTWVSGNQEELQHFYIATGDRHWQYHSVHPLGVEEFSAGALVDANSRDARLPGDPKSTDPEATIEQPFVLPPGENTGGFLMIKAELIDTKPALRMMSYDEKGKVLYETILQ